jgi:hypothetical protein
MFTPRRNDDTDKTSRSAMAISDFKALNAGALVGFADVHLPSGAHQDALS